MRQRLTFGPPRRLEPAERIQRYLLAVGSDECNDRLRAVVFRVLGHNALLLFKVHRLAHSSATRPVWAGGAATCHRSWPGWGLQAEISQFVCDAAVDYLSDRFGAVPALARRVVVAQQQARGTRLASRRVENPYDAGIRPEQAAHYARKTPFADGAG